MGAIACGIGLTVALWIVAAWKPRVGMALGGLIIVTAILSFVLLWRGAPEGGRGGSAAAGIWIVAFVTAAGACAIGVVAVVIAGVRRLLDDRRDDLAG